MAERERRSEELYRKNKKIGKMIKKVIFMLALSMFCVDIMAQPTPGTNPTNDANLIHTTYGIRRSPIAPATLLLLGLGGATVCTMVYRNSKKGGEE